MNTSAASLNLVLEFRVVPTAIVDELLDMMACSSVSRIVSVLTRRDAARKL